MCRVSQLDRIELGGDRAAVYPARAQYFGTLVGCPGVDIVDSFLDRVGADRFEPDSVVGDRLALPAIGEPLGPFVALARLIKALRQP